MQPLDRDNAQVRRDAAAVSAPTLHHPLMFVRADGATATAGNGRGTWSLG
jgi:hypothetical protein